MEQRWILTNKASIGTHFKSKPFFPILKVWRPTREPNIKDIIRIFIFKFVKSLIFLRFQPEIFSVKTPGIKQNWGMKLKHI